MSQPSEVTGRSGAGLAPGGEQGVIHDIGYRGYDGPRLGRTAIRRSLTWDSARGGYGLGRAARTKVVPLLLLAVMCVPVVVAVAVTAVAGLDELPIQPTAYALNMQLVVAVYLAAQAPVSVSRDLRFGVLALHFSRPMERRDYVQAKYAGLVADLLVLLGVPLTLLFAGALLADIPLGSVLGDYLRALAGAALLAVVLAGLGLVIAAATPRRGLGVAAIITVLVLLSGVQAAVAAILLEEGARDAAGWAGLLSPFTLVDGVSTRLLGAESAQPVGPPGLVGEVVFALAAALLVAGCWLALLRRYRKVSVS